MTGCALGTRNLTHGWQTTRVEALEGARRSIGGSEHRSRLSRCRGSKGLDHQLASATPHAQMQAYDVGAPAPGRQSSASMMADLQGECRASSSTRWGKRHIHSLPWRLSRCTVLAFLDDLHAVAVELGFVQPCVTGRDVGSGGRVARGRMNFSTSKI
jgi:hypothetical protein